MPRFGVTNVSLILFTHFLLSLDWHVLALRRRNTLPGGLLSQRFDWLHGDLSAGGPDARNLLDLNDLRICLALIVFPGTFLQIEFLFRSCRVLHKPTGDLLVRGSGSRWSDSSEVLRLGKQSKRLSFRFLLARLEVRRISERNEVSHLSTLRRIQL